MSLGASECTQLLNEELFSQVVREVEVVRTESGRQWVTQFIGEEGHGEGGFDPSYTAGGDKVSMAATSYSKLTSCNWNISTFALLQLFDLNGDVRWRPSWSAQRVSDASET